MASLRSAEVAELAPAPVADLPVNELRSMMCGFVEDGLGRGCGEGGVEAFRTSITAQTRGFSSTHDYVTLTLQLRSSTFGDVGQKLIFRSRRRNVPVGPLCVCKRCSAKPHFLLVPEFRRAEPRSIVDPSIARRLCNPPSSNTQPTFERRSTGIIHRSGATGAAFRPRASQDGFIGGYSRLHTTEPRLSFQGR